MIKAIMSILGGEDCFPARPCPEEAFTCYPSDTIIGYIGRMKHIVIPATINSTVIKKIGMFAFSQYAMESLTFPDTLEEVGQQAFQFNPILHTLIMGTGLTTVGLSSFYDANKLQTIVWSPTLTSIGYMGFCSCDLLDNLVLPASLTGLGDYAFAACVSLTNVHFEGNAPTMGTGVFELAHSGFAITYNAGATGFTTPHWYGYDCTPV